MYLLSFCKWPDYFSSKIHIIVVMRQIFQFFNQIIKKKNCFVIFTLKSEVFEYCKNYTKKTINSQLKIKRISKSDEYFNCIYKISFI